MVCMDRKRSQLTPDERKRRALIIYIFVMICVSFALEFTILRKARQERFAQIQAQRQPAAAPAEARPHVPNVRLVDQFGRPFDATRFTGYWTVLTFGFTHCPDVCPMTMGVLARAYDQLASTPTELEGVHFALLTVDPERDTPEVMRDYVAKYNPAFIGLTGIPEQVNAFLKPLGVVARKGEAPAGHAHHHGYDVQHSQVILLIDPEGFVVDLFSPPYDPMRIAQAIRSHR